MIRVGGDLRLLLQALRPRLLRRQRHHDGRDLQPRLRAVPNASWNGAFISFCPGFTTDDVTGHEWGHAYTEYTHGLIYEMAVGRSQRVLLRHLGRDRRPPQRPRDRSRPTTRPAKPTPAPRSSARRPRSVTVTGGSAAGTYPALDLGARAAAPFTVGPTDMAIAVDGGAVPADRRLRRGQRRVGQDRDRRLDPACGRRHQRVRLGGPLQQRVCRRRDGSHLRRPGVGPPQPDRSSSIATVEVTHADGESHQGRPAGTRHDHSRGRHRQLGALADRRGRHPPGPLRRAARHVEPPLHRQPRQGLGHVRVRLRSQQRPRRRAHQLGHSQPRLRPARRRRHLQRPDDQGDRPDEGGPHLLPCGGPLSHAVDRLRGSRRRHRAVGHGPHRREPARTSDGRPSGQKITLSDVTQVQKAMLAVEMRMDLRASSLPGARPATAGALPGGLSPPPVFTDTFENTAPAWSVSHGGTTADSSSATGPSSAISPTTAPARRSSRPTRTTPAINSRSRIRRPSSIWTARSSRSRPERRIRA